MGLDKISTQAKTEIYFKKHAEHQRARVMHENLKFFDDNCSMTVPGLKDKTLIGNFVD